MRRPSGSAGIPRQAPRPKAQARANDPETRTPHVTHMSATGTRRHPPARVPHLQNLAVARGEKTKKSMAPRSRLFLEPGIALLLVQKRYTAAPLTALSTLHITRHARDGESSAAATRSRTPTSRDRSAPRAMSSLLGGQGARTPPKVQKTRGYVGVQAGGDARQVAPRRLVQHCVQRPGPGGDRHTQQRAREARLAHGSATSRHCANGARGLYLVPEKCMMPLMMTAATESSSRVGIVCSTNT